MGAPGSGKGTQAKLLGERINVPHISSGDILRDAIHRNTPLGAKAKTYMDRGELVPDDVLLGVMEERLRRPDCRQGFILDGFPRTVPQAESLSSMLDSLGPALDGVFWIQVPTDELVRRLSGRRTCQKCGASYHIVFDPPKSEGVCDKCGGPLFQRPDDNEEPIAARLSVFERQTKPLYDYYDKQHMLSEIDGLGSPEDILTRLQVKVEADA
jgi:adenylate kinase